MGVTGYADEDGLTATGIRNEGSTPSASTKQGSWSVRETGCKMGMHSRCLLENGTLFYSRSFMRIN